MMETYLDILTPIIAAGFPDDSLLEKMAASREADLAAVREGRDASGEAQYRLRVTAPPAQIRAALDRRADAEGRARRVLRRGLGCDPDADHTDPAHSRTTTASPMNARTHHGERQARPLYEHV